MGKEIKEVKNTPEEAVYQVGEGKDALTLSVTKGKTTYKADVYEKGNLWPKGYQDKETDYVELRLSSNKITFYSDKCKGMTDAGYSQSRQDFWTAKPVNITERLASKLYDDNSKGAIAVKEFLKKIEGNTLINELRQLVDGTQLHREAAEQERKREDLEHQKRVEELWKEHQQEREEAENALNKFVGAEDEPIKNMEESDNKLAKVRRAVSKKVGLEKVKMPFKGLERKLSQMIFEKKGGKSGK